VLNNTVKKLVTQIKNCKDHQQAILLCNTLRFTWCDGG